MANDTKSEAAVSSTVNLPPEQHHPVPRIDPATINPAAVMGRVVDLISDLSSGFAAIADDQQQTPQPVFTALSPGGDAFVTVSASGGLVSLEFREHWLDNRYSSTIVHEANQAIAAASAEARIAREANPLAGTPLERFAAFSNDPDALFHQLLNGTP